MDARRKEPARTGAAAATRSGGVPERLDALAYLLDNSIPVPGVGRIGFDALIGLVPGFGDAAGALLSAYIVVEAARAGAPAPVLARMLGNVGLEALVGTIPFLGDLFDAGFKANARNVRLLHRSLGAPEAARRSSRAVVLGVALALLLVLGGLGIVAFLIFRAFWNLIAG